MGITTLFIISAPSGAGKTTLITRILPLFPDIIYSVSCTTRSPRPGEEHGIDYHFLSQREFRQMIDQQNLLEWKEVHGNLYGTPGEPVRQALLKGQSVLLDIDVQGAKEVFSKMPDAVGIFILPPDFETLEQRLRSRGTESEEKIRTRLGNARKEAGAEKLFKHHVTNLDLEEAVRELTAIVQNELTGKR
ncbi:guanylate kinase [Thermodesulfobacteriota bacterium]